MNKTNKFSFIIPVYNMEKYLTECLNSVFNQTVKDFEVILINDGSTDSSGEICDQYSKKYDFVHTIHQKNEGLSEARNAGIKLAKGDYIVLLDSDDFIRENALEILSKIIDARHPEVIISNYYYTYENGKNFYSDKWNVPVSWSYPGEVLMACSSKNKIVLMACCIVVKRECLNVPFYPGISHEDELWIPQIIVGSNNIVFNTEPYYCYRVGRIGSITQKLDAKKMYDKLFIIDELMKISKRQSKVNRRAIEQRCAKILTGSIFELNKYKTTTSYQTVACEIRKRLWILGFGEGMRYNALFVSCAFLGVKNTSLVWNKIRGLK